MNFVIGQRWISESESYLGLGIVTQVDHRTVTLSFPATTEQRVYSMVAAPLVRMKFLVGDSVNSIEGWSLNITEVIENRDIFIYQGYRTDTHQVAILLESQIDHNVSFSKPQDRLFSAQIDRSDHFTLRYQAFLCQQAQFQSPLRGMRGIRASLIPHQLHIAKDVGQRLSPRVLLADEVGMGKTIEAGMIIQQQLFAGRANRILILVPESLQHQWLVEMLRRFSLNFSLFDEERCADFNRKDEDDNDISENPFQTEPLVICSLDWLQKNSHRAKQLLETDWDMLVVDEAHHLEWNEQVPSLGYQFVAQLSQQIPAVLLLTATPEQLGMESHFARLKLLDPDRFYSYRAFVAEQQQYRPVATAIATLLNDLMVSDEAKYHIQKLLAEEDVSAIFDVIVNSQISETQRIEARHQLIRKLMDRHGTSRVLFRNTRQSVKGFPNRHFHQIILPMPAQYTVVFKMAEMLSNKTIDNLLYPETFIQKMNADAKWWRFDPRIEWLITFLKKHRDEKVLVICRVADIAIQLEQILREREGIRSAVFHEKMSIVERDKASAYFAQYQDGAQVLISSAIGSEGRNFQFAKDLIFFNLPDNPDLLEQSIGRLDRIGQKNDVDIYVPCFEHSAQWILTEWYHRGLNAFEETCPMGAMLFKKCQKELQIFLYDPQAPGFEQFINKTAKKRYQLKKELEQGRDRLLELNSHGGEEANLLAKAIAEEDKNPQLVEFALKLFDVIGVEQEDLGEDSIVITPTGHMLVPDFPGLPEDGCTVTFNRQFALMREDVEFLTWDHPMVRHGIDLITTGDLGKSAVSMLMNKKLPAGTMLVEFIYLIEVQAPQYLQLTRFLPPTPIRLLLDNRGNDLSKQVSFMALERQLKPVNKQMANKIVKMVRNEVENLIHCSEKLIVPQANLLIEKAKRQANTVLGEELNRLISLKVVNKNIRADEITALEQLKAESIAQLSLANWRLDSLRVIVANQH